MPAVVSGVDGGTLTPLPLERERGLWSVLGRRSKGCVGLPWHGDLVEGFVDDLVVLDTAVFRLGIQHDAVG